MLKASFVKPGSSFMGNMLFSQSEQTKRSLPDKMLYCSIRQSFFFPELKIIVQILAVNQMDTSSILESSKTEVVSVRPK